MNDLNVYFITNIFLLIMVGYIFFKTSPDLMKQREQLVFKRFILTFVCYIIFNTLWTIQEKDLLQLPPFLFKVICALSLSSVILCSFCFYRFLVVHFGYLNEKKLVFKILSIVPIVATVLLTITSIWTQIIFSVTDDLKIVTEGGYIVLPICALIYFVIIIIRSSIESYKSKSPQARRNSITMILTTVFLLAWVFVDNLLEGLTIIPLAVFFVILIIFITLQQSSINTDSLTQMNNRRRAMEYLAVQLDNVSNDAPIYVYICDINHFKMINDTFGHLEGDQAIIILASAIKEQIQKNRAFAARYGGDEFIIVAKPQNNNFQDLEIIDKINDLVKQKCEEANKPYDISITAGVVKCTDKSTAVETYLKEADQMLYENKEKREFISPIKE